MPTRLAVIEDHALVADALASALRDEPDFEVVAVYSQVSTAATDLGQLRPDVVIADLKVGHEDGLEIMAAARQIEPPPRVVVLTAFDSTREIERATRAGASGFVRKGEPLRVLFDTLRLVAAGKSVTPAPQGDPPDPGISLSPRERQVLEALAEGMDTAAISAAMNVSPHTTRNQVKAVLAKLGAGSRLEAVAIARRLGLLDRT